MSVGCLLGAPAAKGLFRRAIPQSGAASNGMSEASAALIAGEVLAKLGVDPADCTDEELVAAQAAVAGEIQATRDPSRFGPEAAASGMGWSPMWGADVLPQPALDAIRGGSAKDVDILIGTTRHEFLLFLGMAPEMFPVHEEMLPVLFDRAFKGKGAAALERYQANRPGAPAMEILGALQTDSMFRIPAIRLADAQVANGANVFFYRFDWESPAFNGRIRAGHALELPFTWDNLLDFVGIGLTGGQGPQALADEMHGAWVRFISEGAPGWAPYDTSTRTTRVFGGAEEVLSDPDGDERLLWDGVT
jgi:para-nitrobenzyl esterase